jgi:hypothetical protein
VEWLAGGESERRCKVPAAAVMVGWRAAARGEGGWVGFYRRRPSSEIAVMREMLAVARRPRPARVRRGAADGPPVRGEPRAGTARRGPRGPGRTLRGLGVRRMGRRVPRATVALGGTGADAEASRHTAVAQGRARRRAQWRSGLNISLVPCLSQLFSKNLNKSRLTFEYECCRSSHPLQLSKRLYGDFLHRF